MSDTGSDLAPLGLQPEKFGQSVDAKAAARDVQGQQESSPPQEERRNPAWLVLEILFITVLVFFWL